MPQRGRDSQSLSTDAGREARIREVAADVTMRLSGVCAALPPDEFAALARQIAELTVKYEARSELRAARVDTPPGRTQSMVPIADPLALPAASPALVETLVRRVRTTDRETLDAFVRRTWRLWSGESLRPLAVAVDRRRAQLDGE